MATALTFTSLKLSVAQHLERGSDASDDANFFAALPGLINKAERRIATDVKVLGYIRAVTSAMEAGVPVIAKPDRWRDTVSFNFGTGASSNTRTPLFTRAYEYLRAYAPDESVTGQPKFYGDYDFKHWLIAPTPDAAYPFEVLYHEQPPLLDDATQTNWLTDYQPRLLLIATLIECVEFNKSSTMLQVWQGEYQTAVAALNGEDKARITDRASFRTET